MSILGRRPFLTGGLGLAGLGAAGWGGSVALCSVKGGDLTAFVRPLFVALADIREVGLVGQAFLTETGAERLMIEILSRSDFFSAVLLLDDSQRRRMLGEAVRADFAAENTVLANRWVVARAEAQIAAAWVADLG